EPGTFGELDGISGSKRKSQGVTLPSTAACCPGRYIHTNRFAYLQSMKVRIAPSILSADFGRLAEEIRMCEEGGADVIHLDVMDGRFVPNITFGEKVIARARKATSLPLDVHMMVVEPENYFESFAGAGATGMTIHVEAAPHLQRQLARIRELGCLAGAAVNPGTSLGAIHEVAL